MRIRRLLTDTPLARLHDRVMAGHDRRRGAPIPWGRFEREGYPEPALSLALDAQRELAWGEYGAVDLFARLASALSLQGAPFDLVAAASSVPADEIRHADYALRMASLLAGREVGIDVDCRALERRWGGALTLERLDDLMTQVVAIDETLAAAMLTACAERATDPVARALFRAIVADEVHHARLGWYYLAWRAPQWTRAERQRVADGAGLLVMGTERRFWQGRDAPRGSQRAARALEVLESRGQREAVRRVMEGEIVPALDAIGLGASHAWRGRERIAGA